MKSDNNPKKIYWYLKEPDNILSPSTYLYTLLKSYLDKHNVQIISDFSEIDSFEDSSLLIINCEDHISEVPEDFDTKFNNSLKILLIFHDSDFLENKFVNFLLDKNFSHSRIYCWENFFYSSSLMNSNNSASNKPFFIPYPWIDKFTSEKRGHNHADIDRPLLVHARGTREGRFEVLINVLSDLNYLDNTIIISDKQRVKELNDYFWSLDLNYNLNIYTPSSIHDLQELFSRASFFLNPCFSSIRPNSFLMMNAIHKKVPVVLSDFGSNSLLPSKIRKYQLGENEETSLKNVLSEILSGKDTDEILKVEDSLYEYSVEFGNPEILAKEILEIINLN